MISSFSLNGLCSCQLNPKYPGLVSYTIAVLYLISLPFNYAFYILCSVLCFDQRFPPMIIHCSIEVRLLLYPVDCSLFVVSYVLWRLCVHC